MNSQRAENVRARTVQLAPQFRVSIPVSEAAERIDASRTSVARIFRVFRLIDANRTDGEIIKKVRDFSLHTIAEIRLAYAGSLQGTGDARSIRSFLAAHRKRMHELAAKLVRSISSDVEPWPSGWLTDEWPRPWTGSIAGKPRLKPESEPQFARMLDHLEKLRVRHGLHKCESSARELRYLATEIEQDVPRDARGSLSGDLLKAAILYGSQMAEAPSQAYPEMTITGGSDGTSLSMNAFLGRFADKAEAASAKTYLIAVIDHVKQDPTTGKFFSSRAEAQDALERVAKLLEVSEWVNREIDLATCPACEALVDTDEYEVAPSAV